MNNELSIKANLNLPGFSFAINETFGSGITGVFGHSGAGKSTLLQCISGVIQPHAGEVKINGRLLFSSYQKVNVPTHKRRVGYVFQDGRLFPHYTVQKNVLYGSRFLKGRTGNVEYDKVVDMLEIRNLLQKFPSDISGGERQRVALGRALLAAPDVLLLDEPFSALDQKLRQQIIPFISKIAQLLNIPVLIVSHDLPDVLKLTSQICIVKGGHVFAHGNYKDLLKKSSVFEVLPVGEILNTINLEVKKIDPEEGLVTLNGFGENRKINVLFEPEKKQYELGNIVKVFLKPDDIVLSTRALIGTSFRNMLKGTVIQIVNDGPKVLCQIDCGFPLMAEVSKASQKQLSLKIGQEIYCLFKTLALDSMRL